MEKLTASELSEYKKKHAAAERSETPAISTRKMINVLLLLADRIKPGQSLTGEVVRSLVTQVEQKGFSVPDTNWKLLDTAERRSLQAAFDTKTAGLTLPFQTRAAAPASKYSDEELRAKHLRQQKQFEAMLEAEAPPDPLMKLAKVRAAKPTRKGKLSPADQALYDQHKKLTGKR